MDFCSDERMEVITGFEETVSSCEGIVTNSSITVL